MVSEPGSWLAVAGTLTVPFSSKIDLLAGPGGPHRAEHRADGERALLLYEPPRLGDRRPGRVRLRRPLLAGAVAPVDAPAVPVRASTTSRGSRCPRRARRGPPGAGPALSRSSPAAGPRPRSWRRRSWAPRARRPAGPLERGAPKPKRLSIERGLFTQPCGRVILQTSPVQGSRKHVRLGPMPSALFMHRQ